MNTQLSLTNFRLRTQQRPLIVAARLATVVAIAAALSGCAGRMTRDGMTMPVPGSAPVSADKRRDQLLENARNSAAKSALKETGVQTPPPGAIIIGELGAYYPLEDAKREKLYQSYVKNALAWNPANTEIMSRETFDREIDGQTHVVTFNLNTIYRQSVPALVTRDLKRELGFPSLQMSLMFQMTGDLVMAESAEDGHAYVRRVLCRNDDTFSTCSKQYRKGQYDRVTGQEIDKNMAPKDGGAVIDPVSLGVVSKG